MKVRLLLAPPVLALAAAVISVPPALAAPDVNGEFAVSGVGTNNQIALGPDGNIWVTLDVGNDLARITPAGAVTEFNPATVNSPVGIAAGPGGKLWVTQANGVAVFDPAAPNAAVATTINDIADPRAITRGPDGNMWTASGDKVIKIPPGNPAGFTSFATTGVQGARWIASGGNGQLWVADFAGAQIVSVTTAGVGTGYATGGGPQGVARGPGQQIGYSNPGTDPHTLGRITPGGAPQTTNSPQADPFGVTLGSDNAYWYAQFATNNLARLTPAGARSTLAGFSANAGPRQITRGPGNTLWVTLDTADKVARVTGVVAPPPGPPQTTITEKPDDRVTTNRKRAKVRYEFTSSRPTATFECRLKRRSGPKASWESCTSPQRYRLKPGRYSFKVRATAAGRTDATPAQDSFRVVRKR